jgi:hypothetical protein
LWVPQFGGVVSVLASAGLAILLIRRIGGVQFDGLQASAAGLAIGASVFPFFFAVWESRHQIEAAPAFILLAAAALFWLDSVLPWRASPRTRAAILIGGTAVTLAWNVARVQAQPELGYRPLAQSIVRAGGGPIESVLISSDPLGEGAFIAELAQLDTRPGRFVLRSSKILAQTNWMGRRGRCFFETQTQLEELLASVPLQLAVLDRARAPSDPHEDLLLSTLTASPDLWVEWRPPGVGEQLRVFRRRDQSRLGPKARERLTALQLPD